MLCDVLGNFHENIRDGWVGQIACGIIFIGMIKLKHILLEFVDQTISQLQKYLESPRSKRVDEVLDIITLDKFVLWFINADEKKIGDVAVLYDYTEDKDEMIVDSEDYSVESFKTKYPDFYQEMYDYLKEQILSNEKLETLFHRFGIDYEDFPSWYYMTSVNIVKNQWLVHGTDARNLPSIKTKGFTQGVSDFRKLGLTTWFDKTKKSQQGYNFAYTIQDFQRFGYSDKHGLTYGEMVVVFRASGLRCYHDGDGEYQVIFNGKTATDIVPVFQEMGDGDWYINSSKLDKDGFPKVLYRSENLVELTKWLDRNYTQYRKAISWEKPKND